MFWSLLLAVGRWVEGITRLVRAWNPWMALAASIVTLVAVALIPLFTFFGSTIFGTGADRDPPGNELAVHLTTQGDVRLVSGDCESDDLVAQGEVSGAAVGDFAGQVTGTFTSIFYADEACQRGLTRGTFTITDSAGNALSWTNVGPNRVLVSPQQSASGISIKHVSEITGGTGIYEGASGYGNCDVSGVSESQPDGPTLTSNEADCSFQLITKDVPLLFTEPLIVQLGANPTEVRTSSGSADAPQSVLILVEYSNTQDHAQTALMIRLPVPEGTRIRATARGEQQQLVEAGERSWQVPDLPAGERHQFEFTLELLAADTPTITLVVDVHGEGFERPVQSNSAELTVLN